MFAALSGANPGELVLAGCCFAAAVACSAASWRTLIGRTLSLGDACARYGTGSLVNTFVPARAGDAVRLGLFGRVVPGGLLAAGGVAAAVGTARWLTVVPLAIGGAAAAGLSVPPLALAAAGAAALPLAAAWLLACRGSRRAAALLAPLRGAGMRCLASLFAWVAGTIGARVAAATLAAAALGVPRPLTAALLVVPALELAGIVPLTPANFGVAGGAAALAFHAHGVPLHAALAAGLALHAVETVTGLAFGMLGAGVLMRHRRVTGLTQGRSPHGSLPGQRSRRPRCFRQGGTMSRRVLWVLPVLVVAAIATVAAVAGPGSGPSLTPVSSANTKSPGYAPPSVLSPELTQVIVAQGATKVENPGGGISYYGYDNDLLNAAGQPVMVPAPPTTGEAHKTEPDKNTYLVFRHGLPGADPSYDYGTHFLFQGHETGSPGYITRINLDADPAHRVTVLATADATGAPIADIDGSTWDPWAQRLLLTTENSSAPTYAATPGYPSTVTDVSGALGRGGYEGIQNDSAGEIWIVEDVGGSTKTDAAGGPTKAKRPNSFVFRYVPASPGDLQHGKLEALQVLNAAGAPITFASQAAVNNPDQVAVHTYGTVLKTKWIVIHDTATDGTSPFGANALAKAAGATPFKRPENGQFRPGSHFTQFFFDETGDTDATSVENDTAGGWGSILKLTQSSPTSDTGTLTLFYKSDESTAGLDNVTFLSRDAVTFVQDAGDTLHTQASTLDSGYVWNVNVDYSKPGTQPFRWLAEGRDPSATLDSANGGFGKNEGDNEITGVHVSDGDPGAGGILGAKVPDLLFSGSKWRWFYTQQHGDNNTWEVIPSSRNERGGDR